MGKLRLRTCFLLLFIGSITCSKAQYTSTDDIQQRIIGVWQNVADSNQLLNIMSDYIKVIDSNRVVLTYTYSFSHESCSTSIRLPAATGVYLIEIYNGKTVCCALGEVGRTTLKITYPEGNQVVYAARASLPHNIKPQ
jgi:hypothetical protein